jgi:hypothetical protein
MLSICVLVGALHWSMPTGDFTLAWTHSVEKVRWEEDYVLKGRMLSLQAARIRGSGAGMEPPADAVWRDGAWHYTPASTPLARLVLANSSFGGHYDICFAGDCRALPVAEDGPSRPTIIEPCPAS